MLSCPMHGRRLETEQAFWRAEALGRPAADRAAHEHIWLWTGARFGP